MKKKMTKKRIKKEFSDPEIETWVQDFRRACSEEPDDNEELFPNDMNEVNSHVSVLEDLIAKKPSPELKVELRVYKAHRSGGFKGFAMAVEWFGRQGDNTIKDREEEIKPTMFDGGPMFKDEEEFQKMKKSLAEDPYTPKGRWEEHGNIKEYIFDKPKKSK